LETRGIGMVGEWGRGKTCPNIVYTYEKMYKQFYKEKNSFNRHFFCSNQRFCPKSEAHLYHTVQPLEFCSPLVTALTKDEVFTKIL
jgi:hypothetical protein